jgi:hypothetical protein
MKVDKQLPVTTVLDQHAQTKLPELPASPRQAKKAVKSDIQEGGKLLSKDAGFNLQLNQQLSSMQAAESYLSELEEQLTTLKLKLSRKISSLQRSSEQQDSIMEPLQQLNKLLEQRVKRSGSALDATLTLRLNEPLRSRFSINGLDSIQAIQSSGKETLLFDVGHVQSEPVAVVLEEDMSEEQILRRFNEGLAQVGIHAELGYGGALKFSSPEVEWEKAKKQLRVQGEGKLFTEGVFSPVSIQKDGLQAFDVGLAQRSKLELRQLLGSVITTRNKTSALREQLKQRQVDVSEFLAQQEIQDEKQWADCFVGTVFKLSGDQVSNYGLVSRAVTAQCNLSRFSVVSLML